MKEGNNLADRIIQTETLQSIANALRGGASQSATDKINVTDFAEVAQYLKEVYDSFVGYLNKNPASITIPDGATMIGSDTFRNFTTLEEVNLPNSLTSIGNRAFNGCTNISRIEIPIGVETIGNLAFGGCTTLEEVMLPTTITSIGTNAFNTIKNTAVINCAFSEGTVSGAPWGAPETVTINYLI